MFKRLLKAIPVSLVAVFTLTSCAFIENILSTILVNAAMNMPLLVNGVDVLPEGTTIAPELIEWGDDMPIQPAKRADLNYLKNVLVVPKEISSEIFGLKIGVTFDVKFTDDDNEDVGDHFHSIVVQSTDLPDGLAPDLSALPFDVTFSLAIYIPVGESDILDGATSYASFETLMQDKTQGELVDATNQETEAVKMVVTGKGGNSVKTKSFYFNLLKPEFGDLILDELFNFEYFMTVFEYNYTDADPNSFKLNPVRPSERPTDPENPMIIPFFKETIVIAKEIHLADFTNPVTVDVVVNENWDDPSSEKMLYQHSAKKSIEEINAEFDGDDITIIKENTDIEVHTFTPVGSFYEEMPAPAEIDDIRDIGSHLNPSENLKEMYNATQMEGSFSLEVTVEEPNGETRTETYYFRLTEPQLDEEILDHALDNEYIVNKIRYDKVDGLGADDIEKLGKQANSAANPIEIEYITETLAIPQTIILNDYGYREIAFSVEIEGGSIDLYPGTKALKKDGADLIEGIDATVQTLTPTGGLEHVTLPNNIEDFANELQDIAKTDTERLYEHASSDEHAFKIIVTGTVINDEIPAEDQKSGSREFFFNAVPANVDREIVDFIIDEDALLSVVNYNEIQNGGDYNDKISNVGNDARDSENPLVIEHMVDTLVIPKEVTLTEFDNKQILIDYAINVEDEDDVFNRFEGLKTGLEFNSGKYLMDAQTITPLGSYADVQTTSQELDEFGEELQDLGVVDLYKHSQGDSVRFALDVTIELNDKIAETTFYLEVVKADLDTDIAEHIFDNHTVIYRLDNNSVILGSEVLDDVLPYSTTNQTPYDVQLFSESLIMPSAFNFADFEDKQLNFDVSISVNGVTNNDYFIELIKHDHEYEGNVISARTLTGTGAYDGVEEASITELHQLISHIQSFENAYNISVSNSNEPPLTSVIIRVDITLDGYPGNVLATRDYHFNFVPSTF